MTRADQRYDPSPSTSRDARMFVDGMLRDLNRNDIREDAAQLTGELVSDALRQKPSHVAVLVEHDNGVVRVEVSDDPGLILTTSETAQLERHAGRRLLRALSRRWGSEADRNRTTTWFELGDPSD